MTEQEVIFLLLGILLGMQIVIFIELIKKK
jgi:hypothetical protein